MIVGRSIIAALVGHLAWAAGYGWIGLLVCLTIVIVAFAIEHITVERIK